VPIGIERKETALGQDRPSTLTSVSNLALVLQNQGKYEAHEQNQRALKGRARVLGAEHPDTLVSLNHLADNLRFSSQYEEAETGQTHLATEVGTKKSAGALVPMWLA
jgi:hypothetical protein